MGVTARLGLAAGLSIVLWAVVWLAMQ